MCVFPAQSKCTVHAVRLRMQCGTRSLQDDMNGLTERCACTESRKQTHVDTMITEFLEMVTTSHEITIVTRVVSRRTSDTSRQSAHEKSGMRRFVSPSDQKQKTLLDIVLTDVESEKSPSSLLACNQTLNDQTLYIESH